MLGLFLVLLVFDFAILGLWQLQGANTATADMPPHTDPFALISNQLDADPQRNISTIGFDTDLSFASLNGTDIGFIDLSSLKPIENNLFQEASSSQGPVLLYDELIVRQTLAFNATLVNYLNSGDPAIFSTIAFGSKARVKLANLAPDSQIEYHRLAFGEILHNGPNYYLIVQANYTLRTDGESSGWPVAHKTIFIYQLQAVNNTMLITDFEQLEL
ncbi:MAG: hypothetical protein FWF91_02225 [Coriobacteriia bacterium]|nr:hypothetical protein [Coriobacteriia bacterium]